MPARRSRRYGVMRTYAEAADVLGGRNSLRLCHNTYLVRCAPNLIVVKLYATSIIEYFMIDHVSDRVSYYTGFYTATTKDRLSRFGPVRVYQRNHQWYFEDGRIFLRGVEVRLNITRTHPPINLQQFDANVEASIRTAQAATNPSEWAYEFQRQQEAEREANPGLGVINAGIMPPLPPTTRQRGGYVSPTIQAVLNGEEVSATEMPF